MELSIENLRELPIEQLFGTSAAEWLNKTMDVISTVQRSLISLSESTDSESFTLLKIGTVFQVFLFDTLATGKKADELTKEDWQDIAGKVAKYSVLEEEQSYSEFVFTLYADYIDLSAQVLESKGVSEEKADSVRELSTQIRLNAEEMHCGIISETQYVDDNLWLSLEAMIKCLSLNMTPIIGPEYTQLLQSITQLGFEYGRYTLYAKEQAILQEYLDKQKILDEQLRTEYEIYLAELNQNADRFRRLINAAFNPGLREALEESVAFAKACGVREDELLKSVDEIDAFFM